MMQMRYNLDTSPVYIKLRGKGYADKEVKKCLNVQKALRLAACRRVNPAFTTGCGEAPPESAPPESEEAAGAEALVFAVAGPDKWIARAAEDYNAAGPERPVELLRFQSAAELMDADGRWAGGGHVLRRPRGRKPAGVRRFARRAALGGERRPLGPARHPAGREPRRGR